jgi:SAM-dependent methyltransferase
LILHTQDKAAAARDPYRFSALLYNYTVGPLNAGLKRRRLQLAPPKRGMKVLDAGCGTGADLEMYSRGGCEVYGIDLSGAMLKAARKRLGRGADLRLADAARLPFPDKTFDLVLSTFTLHEMPRQKRAPAVIEALRVMKDHGRLLLTDFRPGPYRFPVGWAGRAVICILEAFAGWTHLANGLDFIHRGGLPGLIRLLNLQADNQRYMAGGAVVLYLFSAGGLVRHRKK